MLRKRRTGPVLLVSALLLTLVLTACGSSTSDQPAEDPGEPAATATPGIDRLLSTNLEEFNGWLSQALEDQDPETIMRLMSDPFELQIFQMGGFLRSPSDAAERLNSVYPPEGFVIDCGDEPPQDIWAVLGTSRAEYYALSHGVLYCAGWGPEGLGQALLLLDLDDAGYLYWTEATVALTGFLGASR